MKHLENMAGTVEIRLTDDQVQLLHRVLNYFHLNMEYDPSTRSWYDTQKMTAGMKPTTKLTLDQLAMSFRMMAEGQIFEQTTINK